MTIIPISPIIWATHRSRLGSISRYTGGNLYFYPGFNSSRVEDVTKFGMDMCRFLSNPLGLEAVLRVRATKGKRIPMFELDSKFPY
jgi:protein transport protein SEC24